MTQISFTQRADGWYEATVTGFSGVLQVDRFKPSPITIYAKTNGGIENALFSQYGESTLVGVELPECVTMRIECNSSVKKAQYEKEDE